ncbi:hypothetical protein L211DRAFT_865288 [Terfezia boudieri ATCC MYA-4762]|uniref:Uncharacterized protein n=1 Tax=Terfezia boudieri ATCC MYA-4762 TaxID=1051890 RepID=A0A3N4MFW4_9PEZI|nr:hypothetical protein L211DRAFT_865288 [Terfezia boudieri ATCC MYA-4762]
MYISHFLVAPLLLHRYFPSKVGPTALVMASVAPDIVSDLYLIMMEFMRMMFKQKVEIHDHTKPPGWIELDSGKPLGIGEWTHSWGGAMWWDAYEGTNNPTQYTSNHGSQYSGQVCPSGAVFSEHHSITAKTTYLSSDVGNGVGSDEPYFPGYYWGEFERFASIPPYNINPHMKALLRYMSTYRSKQSSADSTYPTWTLAIDILLALLTTYLYTLNSHISSQSLYRLTGLTAILFMFQGNLYLSHPASLTTTITVPTTSPNVAGAWWNLIRYMCGAILVGGLLQSIPRHLGNAGREGGGVGEMLRRGIEKLKEEVGGVGELPSLPLTPCGVKVYEVEEVEQSAMEEVLGVKKDQEKEGQEKEKDQGKRDHEKRDHEKRDHEKRDQENKDQEKKDQEKKDQENKDQENKDQEKKDQEIRKEKEKENVQEKKEDQVKDHEKMDKEKEKVQEKKEDQEKEKVQEQEQEKEKEKEEVQEKEEEQEKEQEQEKEKEKTEEQHRGVKRDSGFWDYDTQGTSAQGHRKMECVGAGEGGPLLKDTMGLGILPGGSVKLSSSSTDIPHQEKRRRRSSHGAYAEVAQGNGNSEAWDESLVFTDKPGRATGRSYSFGHGLPGAGGGRRIGDGGTRKAYIH